MMKKYIPQPLNLEGVVIDDEIALLSETLAKNTHEVWAQGRMAEGWTYGETLDAARKTHPCLVAYEQLPESEKDYDRRTSMNAIKAMIALGYQITKQ